jgi:hypothetical protein
MDDVSFLKGKCFVYSFGLRRFTHVKTKREEKRVVERKLNVKYVYEILMASCYCLVVFFLNIFFGRIYIYFFGGKSSL